VSHLCNGDSQVAKEDDYRRYAAETVDLASRANSTSDKGRLLAMAEACLDLADRAHRLVRCRQTEGTPLLTSKLGNDRHEAE
jgi:hypothetical protein